MGYIIAFLAYGLMGIKYTHSVMDIPVYNKLNLVGRILVIVGVLLFWPIIFAAKYLYNREDVEDANKERKGEPKS